MLTVFGNSRDAVTRRSFVQAGLLGVGGLTLSDYLAVRAAMAGEGPTKKNHGKSVILFWMSGGPGHMETWDPKPDAVDQYRGPFGAISTSVAGTQFCELLPEQAKIADKVSIVRSVCHKSGDHTKGNHWMLTGYEGPAFNAPDNRVQKRPAMGSVISRLCGSNSRGMPAYVGVPHLRGGTDNLFHYATYLGGGHDPFVVNSDPNKSNYKVQNLALQGGLTLDRLEHRRELLSTIDLHRSAAEQNAVDMNSHQQNAFELLTSSRVRDAFDISQEEDKLRDDYGRHTFGQSALLARRLVESGVSFVTVNCEPWDHHGTANRYKTEEGANKLIPPFDVALAALVRDLEDRGLSEQTLVVAMGEFGRTPRMNSAAGRDHWGHTFSVLFAGGGMKMGQTIGSSTPRGEYVADLPFDPQDITATVYHHMGLNAHQTLENRAGRPIHLAERGTPITQLIGG
jgi:uncharacterized protein (DUF1501 family)